MALSDSVVIVMPHLKVGGAQKQAVLLALLLRDQGAAVSMLLTNPSGEEQSEDEKKLRDRGIPILHSSPPRMIVGLEKVKALLRTAYRGTIAVADRFGLRSRWRVVKRALTALIERKWGSNIPSSSRIGPGLVLLALVLLPLGVRRPRAPIPQPGLAALAIASRPGMILHTIRLRRLLGRIQPKTAISFLTQTNIHLLLACLASPARLIISERNDVEYMSHPLYRRILRRSLYPLADLITANTEASRESLRVMFPHSLCEWLPNLYRFDLIQGHEADRRKNIVVSCRLEPQKGVSEIITAFGISAVADSGWALEIYGSGSELTRLQELITDLGLLENVRLFGQRPRSEISYGDSAVVIVNSSYEGSSNSLHEAVAEGCVPVVSTRVREFQDIVDQETYGDLAFGGKPHLLAQRLLDLSLDEVRLEELRRRSMTSFSDYWKRANSHLHYLVADIVSDAPALLGGKQEK